MKCYVIYKNGEPRLDYGVFAIYESAVDAAADLFLDEVKCDALEYAYIYTILKDMGCCCTFPVEVREVDYFD